ncbi:hypothetical protein AMJ80_08065 [bacterium SM23_31]|nr:MAG: hypothetical protein AMJ80_08065 [bacterium SM23_31]
MKKWISLLLFLSFYVSPLMAQEEVELFGYFESQIMGAKIKSDFNQLYSNKLRVDIKSGFYENVTFAANFDYITYHGKTEWNVLDFLSSGITSKVSQDMESYYVIPFSDRNFLDNAYIRLTFENLDLTVGKQQISLGTGYVWNPMDVFNIKDVLDPTYEQPGHNAVRMDVPLGSIYTLTALYSPEDTWRNSAKLFRFKGRISHFDYSLIAIEKLWRFHDYTQLDTTDTAFPELPEKRRLLGASTAGELLGLGVWAEYGYNKMENSKDFHELVVGTDYTFDFQTYIMVEFYRNTLGKTDFEQYNINDWMRQFAAEQKAISRDQIYSFIQHPATDFLSMGLSSIYSISDNSLALVPTFNYSFSVNVDIMAYLNFNFGREGKVFAKNTGNGGLLRARIYF